MGFPFDSVFYNNLYFTDNGVIIFQRNSYDPIYVLSYPYKTFQSNDSVTPPVIAPFWADVDLSGDVGELYYQVYDFQRTVSDKAFKESLEKAINTYFSSSLEQQFSATWAVKITWDNVLPFSLYNANANKRTYSNYTNTFQAVLATNGVSSFSLTLFEDGGMRWRHNALPSQHQPKMGYFSGISSPSNTKNFPAFNDPQTDPTRSKEEIYTPDQSIGYNTEQYMTMQNMFPTENGAGTRCYYSRSGALIYGEKEQYFPTPWTYFDFWGYMSNPKAYVNYFWNMVLPTQRKIYRAKEVDPYNACCRYSGSNYLCGLYREKRPLDRCEQYVPPQIGFLFGDPHISTLDGVTYTFNGLGEFTLANIKDENNTVVFKLQGRTAIAGNGTSNATIFVGLAAYTSAGDQVQWTLLNDNSTLLSYNGTTVPLTENVTYIEHMALERTAKGEAKAAFDSGISVSVTANMGILNFVVTLNPKYQNRTEGLLGLYNGNPYDDFLSADGNILPYSGLKKLKESEIFTFGMTWKTTPENSVFTYNASNGETWFTYNNNTFIPVFFDELLSASDPDMLQKANNTCAGNSNCVFDILSTGNFPLGIKTKELDIAFTSQRIIMESFPPNISGPSTIMTSLRAQVMVDYTVSFGQLNLETTSSDLVITGNGTLIWLPKSSAPVFAVIRANNSVATAELGLTLILCNCSNDGVCDYNNAILRSQKDNSKFMTAVCKCSDAWEGEFCTEDFNACLQNICFNTSSCVDNLAPLEGCQCSPCPKGLIGDGVKCSDIDECYENTSDCNQICINTFAGYECSCNAGYRSSQQNSSHCDDIDECVGSSPCGENAMCSNLPGNFSCVCMNGYHGDPYLLCTDINECASGSSSLCSDTSVCINTLNGSYYCDCLPGYTGVNCSGPTSTTLTHITYSQLATEKQTLPTITRTSQTSAAMMPSSRMTTKSSVSVSLNISTATANSTWYRPSTLSSSTFSRQLQTNITSTASACSLVSCPTAYCSNGGVCSINMATCILSCKCPVPYTDNRCILAGNDFMPEPSKGIPKRIVEIHLWLKGEDGSVLSDTSAEEYMLLYQSVNNTATLYLKSVLAFNRNSKVQLNYVNGKAQARITSEFTYINNRTVITYLNEHLIPSIVHEFNKYLIENWRRRQINLVSFEKMFAENITSIEILTIRELEQYFPCNSSRVLGYSLVYLENGFTCISPCTQNYCQNNAECQHRVEGPTCRCIPFSIYSPFGDHCENLAINLRAFFGILFGSLALVVVIIAITILIIYCCRRRKRSTNRNITFYWGSKSITPFNKLQETNLPSNPQLKSWTPHLENVPVGPPLKIKRPTLQENYNVCLETTNVESPCPL
ncbi:mucin-4-like [Spea bombifrons]|uniref:mucin-4-like n=1 Tax=Spea bombifrons TaxID=233779 RepID=UPI00234ABCD3|nr:mucin-4-like [Spea bombifrons]